MEIQREWKCARIESPPTSSVVTPSILRKHDRETRAIRLLVADDDAASRDLLRFLLQDHGFDIRFAENGLEAYELLRQEDVPAIALLDWVMPGMNGLELCQSIRRLSRLHYVYAILLTFKTERRDLVAGLQSGADDYLTKPVDVAELLARIHVGERLISYLRDLRRAEAELEASRLQAISSARLSALGMMAGGIAHEINNPLAIIHGLSSNLADAAKRGEAIPQLVLRDASRIQQTTQRIGKIVKSLRVIARDASEDPFQEAPVRQIVDEALELCRERFKRHSVRLIVNPIDEGLNVFCREAQIAQVLVNMLQNAFDAVIDQPGEKWIEVRADALETQIVFSVVDSGPGISAELAPRIMEPFFTTKPVGKGIGLGLSLSKAIAQQHGGDLKLSDWSGRTCFSLILPVGRPNLAN